VASSTTVPAAAETYKDLVYATTSADQKLDLYVPGSGDGPFPLIILIHGGAFVGGDKADGMEVPALGGLLRASFIGPTRSTSNRCTKCLSIDREWDRPTLNLCGE
jgi:BD-FAE